MIKYSFNKNDIDKRVKDLTISQIKTNIIIEIISFIFLAYFLITGFLTKFLYYKDNLPFIISLTVICVIMLIVSLKIFFMFKAQIKEFYNKSENDTVQYTIEKINDEYIVNNLENESITRFRKSDVKKMYILKNSIIIKLQNKNIIDVPKNKEILDLLS